MTNVSQSGGPLGLKNNENQATSENRNPRNLVQIIKKQLSQSSSNNNSNKSELPGTSSILDKSGLPKSKLKKVMKKKSFPKVASAIRKSSNKKKLMSKSENPSETLPTTSTHL